MIVGLGIDLVDTSRIARDLSRERWRTAHGIFTAAEIRHCSAGMQPERLYAACFAAKEATLKALGADVADLGIFREVEVRGGPGGECAIRLRKRLLAIARRSGTRSINLSVAVRKKNVVAMVILES